MGEISLPFSSRRLRESRRRTLFVFIQFLGHYEMSRHFVKTYGLEVEFCALSK